MTRREAVEFLRNNGLTYEAIGEVLGVSRQRAEQILKHKDSVSNRVSLGKKIIYPNLLKWSIENKCNRYEFLRRMGYMGDTRDKAKLHRVLNGKQIPTKDYIDKMLQATGMTYEVLFEVKQNDEVQSEKGDDQRNHF